MDKEQEQQYHSQVNGYIQSSINAIQRALDNPSEYNISQKRHIELIGASKALLDLKGLIKDFNTIMNMTLIPNGSASIGIKTHIDSDSKVLNYTYQVATEIIQGQWTTYNGSRASSDEGIIGRNEYMNKVLYFIETFC